MPTKSKDTTYQPDSNPLGEINASFHTLYKQQKQQTIQQINAGKMMIICRIDERLIVKVGDQEQEYTINGTRYNNAKAMCHTALAAYYSLIHASDKKNLSLIKRWVNELSLHPPNDLGGKLAHITYELVNKAEQQGTLSHLAVMQYQQKLEPIFAQLMQVATQDEIAALVTTLNEIKAHYQFNSADIFMVNIGGHQPRYKALASLVFKRWFEGLDEHIVDAHHHIHYCEGGASLADAIELIATAMVDKKLAQSLLGSPTALEQDVLAAVAERAIDAYWKKHSLK